MTAELSAFSSANISSDDLARVMRRLGARYGRSDPWGELGPGLSQDDSLNCWVFERDRLQISVALASEDIAALPGHLVAPVARLLGDRPRSRVALVLFRHRDDHFEYRMAW